MERPKSTLGLVAHLVRTRWQSLSARGRFAATVGLAVVALGGAIGARAALCGGCSHSCAAERARMDAAHAEEVAAADDTSPCSAD